MLAECFAEGKNRSVVEDFRDLRRRQPVFLQKLPGSIQPLFLIVASQSIGGSPPVQP